MKPSDGIPPSDNKLTDLKWDWRDKGMVTPPKDQGLVSSCMLLGRGAGPSTADAGSGPALAVHACRPPLPSSDVQCGSCFAYAAVAALESKVLISKGLRYSDYAIDLSEQQLIDCASKAEGYKSDGCNGGYLGDSLLYAARCAGCLARTAVLPSVALLNVTIACFGDLHHKLEVFTPLQLVQAVCH